MFRKKILKIISSITLSVFLFESVVWAYPEFFTRKDSQVRTQNLQVWSNLSDPGLMSDKWIEWLIKYIATAKRDGKLDNSIYPLTLFHADPRKRVVLDFGNKYYETEQTIAPNMPADGTLKKVAYLVIPFRVYEADDEYGRSLLQYSEVMISDDGNDIFIRDILRKQERKRPLKEVPNTGIQVKEMVMEAIRTGDGNALVDHIRSYPNPEVARGIIREIEIQSPKDLSLVRYVLGRLPEINERAYSDTEDFLERCEVVVYGSQKRSYRALSDIILGEMGANLFTLKSLRQIREWMEKAGHSDKPLIIWQNMRLGELYPYFNDSLMERMGIVELTTQEINRIINFKDPIPDRYKKAKYILVQKKLAPSNEDARGSLVPSIMASLAKDLGPVVMVDHSQRILSEAQLGVHGCEKDLGRKTLKITHDKSTDELILNPGLLNEQPGVIILLNPNNRVSPQYGGEGYVSPFDDRTLFLEKHQDVDMPFVEDVTIGGKSMPFYDAFRIVYGRLIEKYSETAGFLKNEHDHNIPEDSIPAPLFRGKRREGLFSVDRSILQDPISHYEKACFVTREILSRDDQRRIQAGAEDRCPHHCHMHSRLLQYVLKRMGIDVVICGIKYTRALERGAEAITVGHFCVKTKDGVYIDAYPEGNELIKGDVPESGYLVAEPGHKHYGLYQLHDVEEILKREKKDVKFSVDFRYYEEIFNDLILEYSDLIESMLAEDEEIASVQEQDPLSDQTAEQGIIISGRPGRDLTAMEITDFDFTLNKSERSFDGGDEEGLIAFNAQWKALAPHLNVDLYENLNSRKGLIARENIVCVQGHMVMVRADRPDVDSVLSPGHASCTGCSIKGADADGNEWFGHLHVFAAPEDYNEEEGNNPLKQVILSLKHLANRGFRKVRLQFDIPVEFVEDPDEYFSAEAISKDITGMAVEILPHIKREDPEIEDAVGSDIMVRRVGILYHHYGHTQSFSFRPWDIQPGETLDVSGDLLGEGSEDPTGQGPKVSEKRVAGENTSSRSGRSLERTILNIAADVLTRAGQYVLRVLRISETTEREVNDLSDFHRWIEDNVPQIGKEKLTEKQLEFLLDIYNRERSRSKRSWPSWTGSILALLILSGSVLLGLNAFPFTWRVIILTSLLAGFSLETLTHESGHFLAAKTVRKIFSGEDSNIIKEIRYNLSILHPSIYFKYDSEFRPGRPVEFMYAAGPLASLAVMSSGILISVYSMVLGWYVFMPLGASLTLSGALAIIINRVFSFGKVLDGANIRHIREARALRRAAATHYEAIGEKDPIHWTGFDGSVFVLSGKEVYWVAPEKLWLSADDAAVETDHSPPNRAENILFLSDTLEIGGRPIPFRVSGDLIPGESGSPVFRKRSLFFPLGRNYAVYKISDLPSHLIQNEHISAERAVPPGEKDIERSPEDRSSPAGPMITALVFYLLWMRFLGYYHREIEPYLNENAPPGSGWVFRSFLAFEKIVNDIFDGMNLPRGPVFATARQRDIYSHEQFYSAGAEGYGHPNPGRDLMAMSGRAQGGKGTVNKIVMPLAKVSLPETSEELSNIKYFHNSRELEVENVQRAKQISDKGISAEDESKVSVEFYQSTVSYSGSSEITDPEAFLKNFKVHNPLVDKLVFIFDPKKFKEPLEGSILPYLYLFSHEMFRVPVAAPGGGKYYRYVVTLDVDELEALNEDRVKRYLRQYGEIRVPEKIVYRDAVIAGGEVIYGRTVPMMSPEKIDRSVYTKYAHLVVAGCKVKTSTFKFTPEQTIFQNRPDLAGRTFLTVVRNGKGVLCIAEDGKELFREPGQDSENAVFTDYVIQDGKFVSGEFFGAFPKYLAKRDLPDDCVVRNIRCDKNGGLNSFLDTFLWKHRQGYENYAGMMAIVKGGQVTEVFDADGQRMWYDPDLVQDHDTRVLHADADYVDGRVVGGRAVYAASASTIDTKKKGIPKAEIAKYERCVITNLGFAEGLLEVGFNRIRMSEMGDTGGIAAKIERGRVTHLYQGDRLIYLNTPEARNAIYSYSYLKDGRYHWGSFYKAMPFEMKPYVPDILPNCAVDNVEPNSNGGVRVFGSWLFQSNQKIAGMEKVVVVFHNGEAIAVCDRDGNILHIQDGKELGRIEIEQRKEKLRPEVALEIIRTFGIVNGFSIIVRSFKIASPLARETMLNYLQVLGREKGITDNITVKGSRKKRSREFFKGSRKMFEQIEINPSDLKWLSSVFIDSMLGLFESDESFLGILEKQAESKQNPYLLREVYRKALEYFTELGSKETPPELKKRLFAYQKAAVEGIKKRKKVLLADECGLGKTITAIAAAIAVRKNGSEKTLIISPKSATGLWRDEIIGSTTISEDKVYVHGEKNEGTLDAAEFVIVNYEAIRGEDNKLRQDLIHRGFYFVVLDEAHRIRNERSLQAEAVMEFDSEYKLLVSGTPIVGRKLTKLFPLLNWLYPDIFFNKQAFKAKYKNDPHLLRKDLSSIMLARLKRDVQPDIPSRDIKDVYVELSGEEKEYYEKVKSARLGHFSSERGKTKYISRITRLKQSAISPSLPGAVRDEKTVELGESSKCRKAAEIAGAAVSAGEKVVIFTGYRAVVGHLERELSSQFPGGVVGVTGKEHARNRSEKIRRFRENPNVKVLVMTYNVGGESLNLQEANNVIFIDYPWTYQEFMQAVDRVHRVGQKNPVIIHRLIARGTIDEYILKVLEESELIHKLFLRGEIRLRSDDENEIIDRIARDIGIKRGGIFEADREFIERLTGIINSEDVPPGEETTSPGSSKNAVIHVSVAGAVKLTPEQEAFVRYRIRAGRSEEGLSQQEQDVIQMAISGSTADQMSAKYFANWPDILSSGMAKLLIVRLEELQEAYLAWKKKKGSSSAEPEKKKKNRSGSISFGDASALLRLFKEKSWSVRETDLDRSYIAEKLAERIRDSGLSVAQKDEYEGYVEGLNDLSVVSFKSVVTGDKKRGEPSGWLLGFNTIETELETKDEDTLALGLRQLMPGVIGLSDYILGRAKDNEPVLLEYIFHEIMCAHLGHEKAREAQEEIFRENYPSDRSGQGRPGHKDGLLKDIMREALQWEMYGADIVRSMLEDGFITEEEFRNVAARIKEEHTDQRSVKTYYYEEIILNQYILEDGLKGKDLLEYLRGKGIEINRISSDVKQTWFERMAMYPEILRKWIIVRKSIDHLPVTRDVRKAAELRYGLGERLRPLSVKAIAREMGKSSPYVDARFNKFLPYLRALTAGKVNEAREYIGQYMDSLRTGRAWTEDEITNLCDELSTLLDTLPRERWGVEKGEAEGQKVEKSKGPDSAEDQRGTAKGKGQTPIISVVNGITVITGNEEELKYIKEAIEMLDKKSGYFVDYLRIANKRISTVNMNKEFLSMCVGETIYINPGLFEFKKAMFFSLEVRERYIRDFVMFLLIEEAARLKLNEMFRKIKIENRDNDHINTLKMLYMLTWVNQDDIFFMNVKIAVTAILKSLSEIGFSVEAMGAINKKYGWVARKLTTDYTDLIPEKLDWVLRERGVWHSRQDRETIACAYENFIIEQYSYYLGVYQDHLRATDLDPVESRRNAFDSAVNLIFAEPLPDSSVELLQLQASMVDEEKEERKAIVLELAARTLIDLNRARGALRTALLSLKKNNLTDYQNIITGVRQDIFAALNLFLENLPYKGVHLVVTGSVARGSFVIGSDHDLYIVIDDNADIDQEELDYVIEMLKRLKLNLHGEGIPEDVRSYELGFSSGAKYIKRSELLANISKGEFHVSSQIIEQGLMDSYMITVDEGFRGEFEKAIRSFFSEDKRKECFDKMVSTLQGLKEVDPGDTNNTDFKFGYFATMTLILIVFALRLASDESPYTFSNNLLDKIESFQKTGILSERDAKKV